MNEEPEVGSRVRAQAVLFGTLFLFWVMLNATFALDTLVVGAFASFIIAYLCRGGLSPFTEFRATPKALVAGLLYLGYFFKELVLSNIRLALIVISPHLPINPGIVKVRTRLKSRMGRLILSNSITLTPGTLTVELDGEWIYIHWVTVTSDDVEGATAKIVAGFERYLEVMYG